MKLDSEKKEFIDVLVNSSKELEMILHVDMMPIRRDNSLSQRKRKEGNALFLKNSHSAEDHKETLRLYNISVASAFEGSEELAMGYGNRSAFLLHINKYEDCITDINRALKISSSNILKVKLLCRKAKCFSALKNPSIEKVLDEIKLLLDEMPDNSPDKENLTKLFQNTKSSLQVKVGNNTTAHGKDIKIFNMKKLDKKEDIFQSVEVKFDEKYGRHLVATRDFKPGEIIYAEKYFASCLRPANRKTNCDHCFETCWTGIPCDNCNWAIFCNEDCKKEAMEKYHDIECSILPCLIYMPLDLMSKINLPIRLLILGLKEANSVSKFRSAVESFDENYEHFLKNKIVDEGFTTVLNLASDITQDASDCPSLIALQIIKILMKQQPSFFKKVQLKKLRDLAENEDVVFLGALFLRLMKITQINAHGISNLTTTIENAEELTNKNLGIGSCIALVSSLINHSCVPNTNRCFTKDGRIVIYAVMPIKKNSQIFDSYVGITDSLTKEEKKKLLGNRSFSCECQSCKSGPIDGLTIRLDLLQTEISPLREKCKQKLTQLSWLVDPHDNRPCNQKIVDELSKCVLKATEQFSDSSTIVRFLSIYLGEAIRRLYDFERNIHISCSEK